MNATPISDSMRFSLRDGAWLFFAVLIHGCLLFIPLKEFATGPREARILAVQLTALPKRATPPVEPPDSPMQDPEPEPAVADSLEPPAAAPIAQQTKPELEPAVEEPRESLTAAALIESTRRFKWTVPEPGGTRILGEAVPYEAPENWRSGIVGLEENDFDGMLVPTETEVVDQWVAADGSRNIVLNTPSGTVCGRARAWDPMNPLVPQLMMFSTCGGGGKRTFKMPDRYMRNR